MKTIFGIIIVTMLLSCNFGNKTKIISKYANGKNKTIHIFDNLKDSFTYLLEVYYENGQIALKGKYLNDKKEGLWIWYYEDGIKSDEAIFEKGFYVKLRKHWWENGNLKQIEIINGKCIGECCNGQVIKYYENGQIESAFTLINGLFEGRYTFWHDNGKIHKLEYCKSDLLEGNYYEWHKNGTKWVTGYYKKEEKDSIWTWYDTCGIPETKQLYKTGKFIKNLE